VLQGAQWSALVEGTFRLEEEPARLTITAAWGKPSAGENEVILQFPVASNRSYSLLWSTLSPPVTWTKLLDLDVQSNDRLVTVTNDVLSGTARFFRFVSPRTP